MVILYPPALHIFAVKFFYFSTDFAKAALELMPKETGNKKVSVENSKKFQAMVKELVKLNNGYLTKSKTIAGKYFAFQISPKNIIYVRGVLYCR